MAVGTSRPGPLPQDDHAVTTPDTEGVIDVLANDVDPDGDPLVVDGIVPPVHGLAFADADGNLVYRPDPGFTGSDRFRCWASDGHGHFSHAEVVVTVSGDPIFVDAFEL